MNGQEVFAALIKQVPGWLDRPIEDLVKIAAVGSVYLATHKALLRKIKAGQIGLAEEDRKTKLADGQAVGKALLDVEARIGELLPKMPDGKRSGKEAKEISAQLDRSGIDSRKRHVARTIARHPEVVDEVIKQAEENEDIPTKTAVVERIRYKREKERREKAEKQEKPEIIISLEEQSYLMKLEETVHKCPKESEIPKNWHEEGFKRACSLARIIYKRLEVLLDETKNLTD